MLVEGLVGATGMENEAAGQVRDRLAFKAWSGFPQVITYLYCCTRIIKNIIVWNCSAYYVSSFRTFWGKVIFVGSNYAIHKPFPKKNPFSYFFKPLCFPL